MGDEQTTGKFYFVANHLCLDFINTEVIKEGRTVSLLASFADLVAWCVEAHLVGKAQARELLKQWENRREAERVFDAALEFRAALRNMMERIIDGRAVPQSTITMINVMLREQAGYAEIVRAGDSYEKRFHLRLSEPAHLLVPVADSAGDLLSEGDLGLVRKCENPSCILYFYDNTKNHARRWCSMSACGNRAKAAAHYQRKKLGKLSK